MANSDQGAAGVASAAPQAVNFQFRKRTTTVAGLLGQCLSLLRQGPNPYAIYVQHRISPQLREKVAVAVSEVNCCRYCTFIHEDWARHVGVSNAELADLSYSDESKQSLQLETLAVQYTQAVAAQADEPQPLSPDLLQAFQQAFSVGERKDIDTVIRAMRIANLSGNTMDALIARLRGAAVPGSKLYDEVPITIVVLAAGVIVVAKMLVMHRRSPQRLLRELGEVTARFRSAT